MKQIKVTRKKDRYIIEIKTQKSQTVSQRDVDIIQDNRNDNFLSLTVETQKNESVLWYDASGLLSIPEFLKTTVLSRKLFLYILRQYIHFDKQLEQNYCKKNAVLFDDQYIFIDPASWHIYFVYVPIQPFEGNGSIRSSLQNLIQYATFDPNEDLQYVQEYIKLVGNSVSFSVFLLQEYLQKYDERKETAVSVKKCFNCGFDLNDDDSVCPMCGKPISVKKEYKKVEVVEQRILPKNNAKNERYAQSDDFTVNEDENGLVTVFRAKSSVKHSAYLKNGSESIFLDHFPFRIGKQIDIVDYQIQNNAVSRKHADLIKEQGKYYLIDLGSTNGTFLNNRKIQTGVREELHSGDKVSFANATYSFIVAEG